MAYFSKEDIAKAEQKEKEHGFAFLTRKEKYMLTGVSPSTQRRFEKYGLEKGILEKGPQGNIRLNNEKYEQEQNELEQS